MRWRCIPWKHMHRHACDAYTTEQRAETSGRPTLRGSGSYRQQVRAVLRGVGPGGLVRCLRPDGPLPRALLFTPLTLTLGTGPPW
jgi:hypothetical protein